MVFSTSSVSLDAPFSDSFTTESLWDVVAVNGNPSSVRMTICAYVNFVKSSWLKSVIQKSAEEGINSYFPVWADRARQEVINLQSQERQRNTWKLTHLLGVLLVLLLLFLPAMLLNGRFNVSMFIE